MQAFGGFFIWGLFFFFIWGLFSSLSFSANPVTCLFLNLVDSFLISFPSQVDIFLMVVDTFLNSWSVSYSIGHFPKYIDVVLTV